MRRIFSLILAIILLISLSGCHYSDSSNDILEPVEFYYLRSSESFVYGSADGVIAAEVREASGHTNDLTYLLSMYLRGPQDSDLRSPFPAGCSLLEVSTKDDTLYVRLSPEFATLENMKLTLACACLAKTCLPITSPKYIRIDSASGEDAISITLDVDSLLLADYSAFEAQQVGE